MTRNLPVDAAPIAEEITQLAAITESGRPYTRRAFTPLYLEGRAYLEQCFRAAGLETRIDGSGNLVGRRTGSEPGRGVLMLGSHSDTVPDGGRFDGIAGISAALAVARTLREQNIVLRHDLEIVDFLAEEVSIFGVSCVGSRGMAGLRPPEWLERASGELTLSEGIEQVGGSTQVPEKRSDIKAFLELHIEQGTVLESEQLDIGIVTAIAGITRIEFVVSGRADHAGTTPMGRRSDALAAASLLVLAVQNLATQIAAGSFHFAATVGEFAIEPNAANVIPGRARLLIDARAERREDMETFSAALAQAAASIAEKTAVEITLPLIISDNPAIAMDADVLEILDQSCRASDARYRRMASGAGHDAAWMARISKAAMIFIPCLNGRSHAPEEHAEIEDIALGAAVLLEAVKRLDEQL